MKFISTSKYFYFLALGFWVSFNGLWYVGYTNLVTVRDKWKLKLMLCEQIAYKDNEFIVLKAKCFDISNFLWLNAKMCWLI